MRGRATDLLRKIAMLGAFLAAAVWALGWPTAASAGMFDPQPFYAIAGLMSVLLGVLLAPGALALRLGLSHSRQTARLVISSLGFASVGMFIAAGALGLVIARGAFGRLGSEVGDATLLVELGIFSLWVLLLGFVFRAALGALSWLGLLAAGSMLAFVAASVAVPAFSPGHVIDNTGASIEMTFVLLFYFATPAWCLVFGAKLLRLGTAASNVATAGS